MSIQDILDTPLDSKAILELLLDALDDEGDGIDANVQLRILQYGEAKAREAVAALPPSPGVSREQK